MPAIMPAKVVPLPLTFHLTPAAANGSLNQEDYCRSLKKLPQGKVRLDDFLNRQTK
jgi:hypothetical protein